MEQEPAAHKSPPPRETEIIVNGRPRTVPGPQVCWDELLRLAFDPVPSGPFICFTITFNRGQGPKPQGMLAEGECVRVKSRMVFNVTATDKS